MAEVYAEDDFTGMDPIEAYKTALMVEGNQKMSPDQAKANQGQNLYDLLSVLPVTGNAIAGHETQRSLFNTALALQDEEWGKAGLEGIMALLNGAGIVAGVPIGKYVDDAVKGASSRASVFVPAGDGKLQRRALARREKFGNPPEKVWSDYSFLLGPEGTLRREISDKGMRIKQWGVAGDTAKLDDFIDHPELFTEIPSMRNVNVRFINDANTRVAARTDPQTGDFILNMGAEKQIGPGDIAKLLQYEISGKAKLPLPKRHGTKNYGKDLDEAAVQSMMSGSPEAGSYITRLNEERGLMDTLLKGGADPSAVDRMLALRNAGNIDARAVMYRAQPHGGNRVYPYTRGKNAQDEVYDPMKSRYRAPFNEVLPVPDKKLTDDEMAEFLSNWRRYGSGKP